MQALPELLLLDVLLLQLMLKLLLRSRIQRVSDMMNDHAPLRR